MKTHYNKIQMPPVVAIKKQAKLLAVSLFAAIGLFAARADSLTWDPTLGGGSGGTGTWNLNSTANWWNGASDVAWKDNSATGTNSAIFSSTAGTVTLNTSLSASNLQFTAAGYTVSGSGTLTLGAGGIDASALGSGTTTIGNALTLSGGQQWWQAGSGSTLAINGTVTRNAGATVDFLATSYTSATLANVNGILGGWATVGIVTGAGADWAANDGTGNIVTYTGYTLVSGSTTGAGASAQNWENSAAGTVVTLTATATINSLVQQGDLSVPNGSTLTLGSGGLILKGISRWLLDGGSGTAGTAVINSGLASGELFIHTPTFSANDWRIWPILADNGATPVKVVKDGPGVVSLQNFNTYTGGTIINNGVLAASRDTGHAGTLGFGTVAINNGGILELGFGTPNANVDYTVTNAVILNGGKVLADDGHQRVSGPISVLSQGATFGSTYDGGANASTGNKALFIDGVLSGSGPINLQQAMSAGASDRYGNGSGNAFNSSVVCVSNNANTYSGTITIVPYITGSGAGSYLCVNGSTALQNATVDVENNTGGQRFSGTSLIFNTGLGSATLGAITGSGNIILKGFNENTYAQQSDAIALSVGNNNSSTTHSGIISGTGSLTKAGTGILTLSGVNTYTGNTTISGGTLVLNGAWVASPNITVAQGATLNVSSLGTVTLSGTQTFSSGGTINGSVNTTSGTKVYAGTDGGYGTNIFSNDLTLVSGALAYLDVGTLAAGSNDLITVAGTLTANNNNIHLKAPSAAVSLQATDYVLISSANPISGSFNTTPTWDVVPVNAGNFSIVTSGNTVKLHYSANSAPSGAGFATPSTVVRNQKTLLTVLATNGVPGTVQTVTVDLTSVGGSASFSLVRSNSSNVFTNTVAAAASTPAGVATLPATVTDSTPLNAIVNITLTVIATNDVWNGAGADNFFSSNLNWTNLTAPGLVGDSLEFAGTTRLAPSMDNNYTVTGVTFDSGAGSFNIGTPNSSTLTLAGDLINNSANAQTLNVPITLNTAPNFNAAAGDIALGGVISGTGGISKTGNGTLTLSGTGNSLAGNLGVTGGTLNIAGGSTAFGNGFSYAGYRANSGALTLSGGSFTSGGDFGVGYSDLNGTAYNATGMVTVANATVSLGGRLIVGRGNNNQNTVSGTVTLNSGGTLNSEGDVLLGFAGNNNLGKVVVNGGTLNVATTTTRWLILGQWDTAQSEVDVNSGQVNINGNTAIRFAINGNTGTNTFNLNGGAVTFYGDNATTIGGSGVLDLHQGNGSTVVNTFNLNGGTLTVPGVTSANTAGSRTFNFNGGTLKATAGSGTFMNLGTGSAVAYVRNGGAIIDDGGFGINIDQPLLHSAISGDSAADGGLTKLGAGILTLTGVNTYNGSTLINAGTLAFTGSGSINNSTNITTVSGATFDVSGVAFTLGGSQSLAGSGNVNGSVSTIAGSKIYGGTDGTYGTNTFNNDLTLVSGVICYLDLGTVSTGTNDQIVVNGTLTANNNIIHLKAPSTSVNLDTTADYVLISSLNAISGTFATAPVWDVAPANAGHYTVVTSGNTVTLHYSASVSAPTVTGSALPSALLRNQSTKITANVTPGSGTIISVTVDLTSVGGTSATLVRSNSSNLYTNTVVIPAAASAGSPTLTVTATDNNSLSGSASIPLTISTSAEVWSGGGANQNWSTNQNWASGSAPGLASDSVIFAGSAGLTPNMNNSYSLTGLSFSNNASSFTIGTANSSALTLTANGIVNNSANAQTLNVPVSLTSAQNINAASGDITISGVVTDNGNGLTKTGNHTLTLSGNNSITGPALVSAGTLNLAGTIAPTYATFGNTAGNSVTTVSGGGSLTAANMFVGNVSNAVSAVYQTGGSVSLSGGTGDLLSIGNWSGSYGYYNAAGGTITVNGISIGGESNPNVWPPQGSGNGIMEVNGATISNNGWIVLARGGDPETGILNVYSGSLTFEGGGLAGNWQLSGSGQTAIINIMGGTVSSTTQGVDFRSADTGILNLIGGTLRPMQVTGQGTINFNGGTLQAVGASATFINVNSAYVHSGGAVFDNNGAAVTVPQALLAPAGNGVHGFSSFTGGAGYIAPPIIIITNGTGDTTGSGATAIAQINRTTGSVTNIVITCPGVNYTATPVFLVSGGGATTAATITGNAPTANTSGGLTSIGSGTLTLSGANTYTGNTTVSAGTLEIAQAVIAAGSTVSIASGAKLQLDFSTTNTVSGLVLNGVSQSPGVYNNNNASTYITGSGSLVVGTAIASNPTNITFSVTGSTMSLSWPSDHLGWILQQQTNSLSVGLGTNWVDVAGTATVTSTNIAINPAARTAFYRLRHP